MVFNPNSINNEEDGGGENQDYSYNDLSEESFDGIDFDRCDFTGANLQGTTFKNCYMRGSVFVDADLRQCSFENVNLRESRIVNVRGKLSKWIDCNLSRADFSGSDLQYANFTNSDLRMANFRNARCDSADFTNAWIKGIGTRGAKLTKAKIHEWLGSHVHRYRVLPPETKCYAYKLTNSGGYGPYHPKIKYYVGQVADASIQDNRTIAVNPVGHGDETNTGIAIAPLDWVLKEWLLNGADPNWKLFRVEFEAKDVIKGEGNAKFNVTKMKVLEEVSLTPYYEELKD